MAADVRDRSIPELLRDLSEETATLVRQEMQLARVEFSDRVKPVTASAGFFGAEAVLGLGAFGAITACLIAALALVLETWLAALIIVIVYGIVAYVLIQSGMKKLRGAKPPVTPKQPNP